MHRAQHYLNSTVFNPQPTNRAAMTLRHLTAGEAHTLSASLLEDARSYRFSASVSLSEALYGLSADFFTWPTVELYYSAFYALRAYMAASGIALFYPRIGTQSNTPPYWIEAVPGAVALAWKGTTHAAILDLFADRFPSHFLLSQPIGTEKPFVWLARRREDANYKVAKFCEPTVPAHFQQISSLGVRRATVSYMEDRNKFLAFDPDHAMVAFPMACLRAISTEMVARQQTGLAEDDIRALHHRARDRTGPLAHLQLLFQ